MDVIYHGVLRKAQRMVKDKISFFSVDDLVTKKALIVKLYHSGKLSLKGLEGYPLFQRVLTAHTIAQWTEDPSIVAVIEEIPLLPKL